METLERRQNLYATNCCKCGSFVEAGSGWLYQDTQSRQAHRDIGMKKHWKVKCDACNNPAKQESVKKMSVAEAKKLVAQHGDRFGVAVVSEWGNEKVTTFDGKPLENFCITDYFWVSPEQFVFLVTGKDVSEFDMTHKAQSFLEAYCLELDERRLSQ
jgi:hypothetical protein